MHERHQIASRHYAFEGRCFVLAAGSLMRAGALPPELERDPCLLYTSDAADERSSVDLGGRRIIKKKNKQQTHTQHTHNTTHI